MLERIESMTERRPRSTTLTKLYVVTREEAPKLPRSRSEEIIRKSYNGETSLQVDAKERCADARANELLLKVTCSRTEERRADDLRVEEFSREGCVNAQHETNAVQSEIAHELSLIGDDIQNIIETMQDDDDVEEGFIASTQRRLSLTAMIMVDLLTQN